MIKLNPYLTVIAVLNNIKEGKDTRGGGRPPLSIVLQEPFHPNLKHV